MDKLQEDLDYYLKLPYKIEIQPIPKEEGGGYFARLPDFGVMGITGDGDTVEEALKMLEEFKKVRFRKYLEEGLEIPKPGSQKRVQDFSGKILIRIPRELHQTITKQAAKNNISLNLHINYLLTKAASISELDIEKMIEKSIRKAIKDRVAKGSFEKKSVHKGKSQDDGLPEIVESDDYVKAA